MAIKTKCLYCGELIPYRKDCKCEGKEKAKQEQAKHYDKRVRRGTNKKYDDFYHSTAWKRLRGYILAKYNGICIQCYIEENKINGDSIVIHHIEPIKESWGKRLEDMNLIPLCKAHHESPSIAEDKEHCKKIQKKFIEKFHKKK